LFIFSGNKILDDGYYTLLARAEDEESSPISIMIDKTKNIPVPTPEAVDTVSIKGYSPPYLTATIIIHNQKPTVYGKTIYGATVQATFQSLLTSSSIIADSSAGDFSITSANALDLGAHQVMLYAVTPEGMRSSTITIPFTITDLTNASSSSFPWWILLIVLLLLAAGAGYWYFYVYKKKKEDEDENKEEEKKEKEKPEQVKKKAPVILDEEHLEFISEDSLKKKKK
jgi:hypothetical protein